MATTPENSVLEHGPAVPATGPRLRATSTNPARPATCETSQPVTLIGSRRDCHLSLNDPDVSKVHCAILHTGRAFLVCDLGSRSGTFLNGRPVRAGPLSGGDVLRVGTLELVLEVRQPVPSSLAGLADGTALPEPAAPPALTVSGRSIDLAAGVAVIGRRSTCDIVLDTPDMSLAHALLFALDGRPVVCDLGSRSGTFLNGQRVQLAWIQDNDRLTIGGETLVIAFHEAHPAALVAEEALAPPFAALSARELVPSVVTAPHGPPAGEHLAQTVLEDYSAARRQLNERALELDRREAELETLGMLLKLELEHAGSLRAKLSCRAAEVEQAANEGRARLALALKHEQALTAAWQELERWHATLEARYRALRQPADQGPDLSAAAIDLAGLRNAAPVNELFAGAEAPTASAAGLPNA